MLIKPHKLFMVNRLLVFITAALTLLFGAYQLSAQTTSTVSRPDLSIKKVLLLHSYSYDQAAYLIMDPIFVKSFRDAGLNLNNVYFEFLDLGRHPEREYWKEMAKSLKLKYHGHPIDVIILLHTTGLDFLIQECKGLFPGVPVVHLIASTRFTVEESRQDLERELKALSQPFIVMPFEVDAKATLDTILLLRPETTGLMVISGAGAVEKRLEQTIRYQLGQLPAKLDVEYVNGLPMDEVLEKVEAVQPKTSILFTTFYEDKTGKFFRPADAGRMISRVAKAPVYGLFETLVGDNGIVGGIMVNQGSEAERGAMLALDILKGKRPPDAVTVLQTPLVPMFDWQQIKRWRLKGNALPHGSIVINRPISFWIEYRSYIIGAIVLFLLETILITSLLVQRRRRKRAENFLREKSEELNQFFDVSLDLLCVADTSGYFVRVNQSFEKTLGITADELLVKPFLEFVHPEDIVTTTEALAKLGHQKSLFDFTNRYRCRDGTYRWLEWRAVPLGEFIYAAARDVTEKLETSRQLEERLKFETLLTKLSRNFLNVPVDRIDSEINQAMQEICNYLGFDIAVVWQWLPGVTRFFTITHLYRSLPGPPVPEKWDARDTFPWCLNELSMGRVIAVSTGNLPPEAACDQKTWHHYEIKSASAFPLTAGGKPLSGALSFNTIREKISWTEDLVKRLQLVAEIFANALDRKNSEEAIHESEERLSLASSAAGVGLWILDLSTNQFWATDKTLELFGLAPNFLLTYDAFLKMVHPQDKKMVMDAVNRASRSNEEIRIEYKIILQDKSVRWLSSRGRRQTGYSSIAERLMGVTMDITERKLMEERIRLAAEEWQSTFDAIPDLVMILDREFRIVRVNAAAKSFFGQPLKDIIGAQCFVLIHGKDKPVDFCPFLKTVESKSHEEADFYDEARKTWFHISTDPIIDEDGEIKNIIYTVKDITEQKRLETEAIAARKELWKTDRLMRMGELTASLAHELNQPLTSILSNARAALRFIETDRLDMDELREILEDISRDDKRAGDIIRSLRSMVRPEEGEREQINMNYLLRDTTALFNSEAIIRNIIIETEYDDLLPPAMANRVQLQQVVINMLMNATESMIDEAENKKITARTRVIDSTRIQVSIRDNGTGINEKELGRLFEPFFTTKRSGLGMGLSLSRSIIEAHTGRIWAENNPDKGATFYFEIPGLKQ